MAYSDLDDVRQRLSVTVDKHDTQLTRCITQASNWIDLQLKPYTTVPLAAPPRDIIDAEADIAAGLFREETAGRVAGERPMPHVLRQRGMDAVKTYIEAYYLGPVERQGYFRRVSSHHSWEGDHAARSD